MQYKTLATLLFATAAIAAPKPQATEIDTDEVPSSIESVLMTAIPTTWLDEFYTNSAFQQSELSAMQDGNYPAWVSSLPSAVETYFTSAIQVEISEYNSENSAASATDDYTIYGTVSPITSGSSTPLSTITSTGTSTSSTGSSTGSSSDTTTGASSAAASASTGTSTSTAGAPAATAGLAMSLAGAAGILGIALAL